MLSALALMMSRVVRIELQVDRGDERAVFVARGDEPAVDLADIGPVGVAGDHDSTARSNFFTISTIGPEMPGHSL